MVADPQRRRLPGLDRANQTAPAGFGLTSTGTDGMLRSGSTGNLRRQRPRPHMQRLTESLDEADFAEQQRCTRCADLHDRLMDDKRKFYSESEHLKRTIQKCLNQLANFMPQDKLDAFRQTLNLEVRFYSPPESAEELKSNSHAKTSSPSASSPLGPLAAGRTDNEKLREKVELLGEENDCLRRQIAELERGGQHLRRQPDRLEGPQAVSTPVGGSSPGKGGAANSAFLGGAGDAAGGGSAYAAGGRRGLAQTRSMSPAEEPGRSMHSPSSPSHQMSPAMARLRSKSPHHAEGGDHEDVARLKDENDISRIKLIASNQHQLDLQEAKLRSERELRDKAVQMDQMARRTRLLEEKLKILGVELPPEQIPPVGTVPEEVVAAQGTAVVGEGGAASARGVVGDAVAARPADGAISSPSGGGAVLGGANRLSPPRLLTPSAATGRGIASAAATPSGVLTHSSPAARAAALASSPYAASLAPFGSGAGSPIHEGHSISSAGSPMAVTRTVAVGMDGLVPAEMAAALWVSTEDKGVGTHDAPGSWEDPHALLMRGRRHRSFANCELNKTGKVYEYSVKSTPDLVLKFSAQQGSTADITKPALKRRLIQHDLYPDPLSKSMPSGMTSASDAEPFLLQVWEQRLQSHRSPARHELMKLGAMAPAPSEASPMHSLQSMHSPFMSVQATDSWSPSAKTSVMYSQDSVTSPAAGAGTAGHSKSTGAPLGASQATSTISNIGTATSKAKAPEVKGNPGLVTLKSLLQ